MIIQRRSILNKLPKMLTGLAIIVLIIGIGMLWMQYKATPPVTVHRPQSITNGGPNAMPTTEKPKPSEFDSYTVAADMPRYIVIPKIEVRAMVKALGVTPENQIEAPRSAFDVGWYDKSVKPGETGAMFVDGHVSAGATPGVFYELKQLNAGDEVIIERGDGAKVAYRVVKSETYDVTTIDMASVLAPVSDKPGLNLITCTGNVIKGTNNYDKRIVVFAEQT